MNCMREIDDTVGGGEICPVCGWNNSTPLIKGALEYETKLQDRYITGRIKSANSEGFTYCALDTLNDVPVDIREFCPVTLIYREEGTQDVCPAEGREGSYSRLFDEFIALARNLSRARELSGIVSVIDLFREHNTVYIVYEHYESVSLRSYCGSHEMDWNAARALFVPVISSLSSMHALGIKHLGISPDTLRVCRDGKMRLSEFSIESARRLGSPIEPDIISGYAAYEQYTPNLECDEITDIYGFTAAMLFAVSGTEPADARKRAEDGRLMISREKLKLIPPNVISAIANGLQVKQGDRTGSFERLRIELTSTPTVTSEVTETRAIKELPKTYQRIDKGVSPKFWLIGSFILTALILIGVVYYLLNYTDFSVDKLASDLESQNSVSYAEVVKVPNFVGGNYNDWLERLKDKNVYRFTVKVESQEFNEEVPEGYIISQSPLPDETVEKNGVVSLVVSRGSTTRTLPAINGMKFTSALEMLEKEGFQVVKEESYSKDIPSGNVMWYVDYNSGDELPYGTTVNVLVSIGKDPADIPASSSSQSQ